MSGPRLATLPILLALAAPALALPTPPAPSPPPKAKPTVQAPARKPPLDFSGTWELDLATSKNIVPTLEGGLTLTVKQTGDRIWMEASGPAAPKASDVVIADGKPYKKELGPGGSGTVTARWSPDGKALLMEIVAGDPKTPQAVQRTRWTLSPDKSSWYRHTITMEGSERRETGLAFRRKSGGPPRSPMPAKTPRPSPPPSPAP